MQSPPAPTDVHAACRSPYHAFAPAADPDDRPAFFRPGDGRPGQPGHHPDEPAEPWDGLS